MEVEEATELRCETHLRILSLDRMRESLRVGFVQKRKRQFALKECKGANSAPKLKRRPKKMQKAPKG